jgi:hypothetical protein
VNILQKTMLAAGVAMFLAAPASALDGIEDYFDDAGESKLKLNASGCGKLTDKNMASEIEIEGWDSLSTVYTPPMATIHIVLTPNVAGDAEVDIWGYSVESKPGKTLAMSTYELDELELELEALLDAECSGGTLESLEVTKFEGKLSKDETRLKVKFQSKGTWMEGTKERNIKADFESKFDNLAVLT